MKLQHLKDMDTFNNENTQNKNDVIEIKFTGDLQKDVNDYFGRFCPIRTECWEKGYVTKYDQEGKRIKKSRKCFGMVRVYMTDYAIDTESVYKIEDDKLKKGDIIKLYTEPTDEYKYINNPDNFNFNPDLHDDM